MSNLAAAGAAPAATGTGSAATATCRPLRTLHGRRDRAVGERRVVVVVARVSLCSSAPHWVRAHSPIVPTYALMSAVCVLTGRRLLPFDMCAGPFHCAPNSLRGLGVSISRASLSLDPCRIALSAHPNSLPRASLARRLHSNHVSLTRSSAAIYSFLTNSVSYFISKEEYINKISFIVNLKYYVIIIIILARGADFWSMCRVA
jgi:hypothetical protein